MVRSSILAVVWSLAPLVSSVSADSWMPFSDERVNSPTGRTYAVIREKDWGVSFELCARRPGLAPLPEVSASGRGFDLRRGSRIVDRDPGDAVIATGTVDQLPLAVHVQDDPPGLLFYEQYARVGSGYSLIHVSANGREVFRLRLEDLFDRDMVRSFPRSVSSTWWCNGLFINEAAGVVLLAAGGESHTRDPVDCHWRAVSLRDGTVTIPDRATVVRHLMGAQPDEVGDIHRLTACFTRVRPRPLVAPPYDGKRSPSYWLEKLASGEGHAVRVEALRHVTPYAAATALMDSAPEVRRAGADRLAAAPECCVPAVRLALLEHGTRRALEPMSRDHAAKRAALPVLLRMALSGEKELRGAAKSILCSQLDYRKVEAILNGDAGALRDALRLPRVDDRVERMMAALSDPAPDVRDSAMWTLSAHAQRMGGPGGATILLAATERGLSDPGREVRYAAIKALEEWRGDQGLLEPVLRRAVESGDETVQIWAMRALCRYEDLDPASVAALRRYVFPGRPKADKHEPADKKSEEDRDWMRFTESWIPREKLYCGLSLELREPDPARRKAGIRRYLDAPYGDVCARAVELLIRDVGPQLELLDRLLKVIRSAQDPSALEEAVRVLRKTAPDHEELIPALLERVEAPPDGEKESFSLTGVEAVRRVAIEILGSLGAAAGKNPRVIPVLAAMLPQSDRDRFSRLDRPDHAVLVALGRIAPNDPVAVAALCRAFDQHISPQAAAEALARGRDPTPLRQALDHRWKPLRLYAMRAVAHRKQDDLIPAVIGVLSERRDDVRVAALGVLADRGSRAGMALAAIEACLNDEWQPVRAAALEARIAVAPMVPVRPSAVVRALGKDLLEEPGKSRGLFGPESVEELTALSKDEREHVAVWAVQQLCALGRRTAAVAPALESALRDPRESLRLQAAFGLAQLGEARLLATRLGELLREDQRKADKTTHVLSVLLEALRPQDREVIDGLIATLATGGPGLEFVSRPLRAIGDPAETALRELCRDENERVRIHAMWALVHPSSNDYRTFLQDPSAEVRHAALVRLEETEDVARSILPEIAARLHDCHGFVRLRAAMLLRRVAGANSAGLPLWTAALADPCPFVRYEALRAIDDLGSVASPVVAAVAAQLSMGPYFVRYEAAQLLTCLGSKARVARPALQLAARSTDLVLAAMAANALDAMRE